MAVIYLVSFFLVVLRMTMLIKGTAVDSLWLAGGGRGMEAKKKPQIDCVCQQMQLGKKKEAP